MPRLLVLLAMVAGCTAAQTTQVRIHLSSQDQVDTLVALDVDLGCACGGTPHAGHDADVFLRGKSEYARLVNAGFAPRVVHDDVETFYRSRFASFGARNGVPSFGQGSMGGYFTYAETVLFLDDLQTQYPQVMSPKVSLGTSLEGRDLWMWKISDNPGQDENEPEILIDALHHAREAGTVMSACHIARTLVQSYGSDPELTTLVDQREIFIVPIVNPDGFVYNETTNPGGGGLWRKNRRPNGDGTFGVDLNRNYGYLWGFDNTGSSPTTSSQTYRGTAAFSEPETTAMKTWAEGRNLRFNHTMHSYSNLVCLPPSHQAGAYAPPPLDQHYLAMTSDLLAMSPGYNPGPTWQVLYPINGGSDDWYYGSLYGGLQVYSYLTEQGSGSDGFWPATNRILPIAEEALLYALYAIRIAGADLRLPTTVVTETSGGVQPGVWESGETLLVSGSVANGGTLADPVAFAVESTNPWVQISGSPVAVGTVGPFSTANAGPVTVIIAASAPLGAPISFDVVATSPSGLPARVTHSQILGAQSVTAVDHDFEVASGWTVGFPGDNATAGIWTRTDPVGTTSSGSLLNPEDDHTPTPGTDCWFTGLHTGGSAGSQDVDGITTLVSPVFDLTGVQDPILTYWRWFATTGNDTLEIGLSNDAGGSWTVVETISGLQNQWTEITTDLRSHLPTTNAMQLYFRAADDPNNSLCEAAIDDVTISGAVAAAMLTATGSSAPGTTLDLDLSSPWFPGRPYVLGAALSAQSGFSLPPLGTVPLDLDPLFYFVPLAPQIFTGFTGQLDGAGLGQGQVVVPNDPTLSGLPVFYAGVVIDAGLPAALTGGVRVVIP